MCGSSRARVYIGTQQRNPSNVGHAHVAHPSRLQHPTIQERPGPASCDTSVKDSIFKCSKKISSAPRLNSANRVHASGHDVTCRVVSRRARRRRRRSVCGTTHLPSGATPYLIYWSTSLPTFHVGLNLAPTSCLCAAKNLGCISYGL
jgi:hypothetical protein